MLTVIKHFMLLVALHVFKNKSVISKLETYWICEELALHQRYSPVLFQTQLRRNFSNQFKRLLAITFTLFTCGMVLIACQFALMQMVGAALCLLGSAGLINICFNKALAFKFSWTPPTATTY